ncbi:hypothetical protein [Streptomyces formicae]|uniref:Uncharacterized protein n=1 Tax=Streptomyces formicae TaxID=1616117 RepID=A0ABY3WQS5_9ACTN|nr:hypothetical protein [Streptomyces formicae]UNM14972.1 hypothetical protein J4032_29030 [Streptomyces formicae]
MADMPPIDAEGTLDDDEMCAPVVNEATGEVRVLAERCATRIFRPGNPFRATIPGPVRDLIADAVAAEGHVTCHSTLPGQAPAGVEPAICRGYADVHGDRSLALRVAAALGTLREMSPPT